MTLRPPNCPRDVWQRQTRAMGRPCYCDSLSDGHCDFCTGLARENGPRWQDAMNEMREELLREELAEMDVYTR